MGQVTVLIGTGAIGQAIARRVSAGKHVLLADLHQGNADAAAGALNNAGFEVSTATVDVSSRDAVHALADTAAGLGDVTGLVHARAYPPPRRRRRRFLLWTSTELPSSLRNSETRLRREAREL